MIVFLKISENIMLVPCVLIWSFNVVGFKISVGINILVHNMFVYVGLEPSAGVFYYCGSGFLENELSLLRAHNIKPLSCHFLSAQTSLPIPDLSVAWNSSLPKFLLCGFLFYPKGTQTRGHV